MLPIEEARAQQWAAQAPASAPYSEELEFSGKGSSSDPFQLDTSFSSLPPQIDTWNAQFPDAIVGGGVDELTKAWQRVEESDETLEKTREQTFAMAFASIDLLLQKAMESDIQLQAATRSIDALRAEVKELREEIHSLQKPKRGGADSRKVACTTLPLIPEKKLVTANGTRDDGIHCSLCKLKCSDRASFKLHLHRQRHVEQLRLKERQQPGSTCAVCAVHYASAERMRRHLDGTGHKKNAAKSKTSQRRHIIEAPKKLREQKVISDSRRNSRKAQWCDSRRKKLGSLTSRAKVRKLKCEVVDKCKDTSARSGRQQLAGIRVFEKADSQRKEEVAALSIRPKVREPLSNGFTKHVCLVSGVSPKIFAEKIMPLLVICGDDGAEDCQPMCTQMCAEARIAVVEYASDDLALAACNRINEAKLRNTKGQLITAH